MIGARGSAVARVCLPVAVGLAVALGCDRKFSFGTQPLPSGAVAVTSYVPPAPYVPSAPSSSIALPSGGMALASFAELAARADPAVVSIKTQLEQPGHAGLREIGEGLGSAFVFDSSGLILTNYHVIRHAKAISVVFGRTRLVPAKVVGRDPTTDVAVLRVEANALQALPLGDSSALRVGDWVVAIGNPFGLAHTVSAGILSARDRTKDDVQGLPEGGYYDFLQTDASINPGNSGGPLLDTAGRVVGMNTGIRADANSIGFAIPINLIKEILPLLLRDGVIRRSAIGVNVGPVFPEDLDRLGLTGPTGAMVTFVVPGGPADRAGLAVDDVILEFQGKPVESGHRLRWVASLAGVGSQVVLRIARGGRLFDLKMQLGELPPPAP